MYQQPMSFGEATKLFWTRAFDFKGRSRRKEYWVPFFTQSILYSIVFIMFIVLAIIIGSGAAAGSPNEQDVAVGIIGLFGIVGLLSIMLMGLILLIPNLSLLVRRLHDTGRSGKWVLVFYVLPIVLSYLNMFMRYVLVEQSLLTFVLILQILFGITNLIIGIWCLIWCTQDSQPGSNQWGNNLKGINKDGYYNPNHHAYRNPYQSNYHQPNPYQNQDSYRR